MAPSQPKMSGRKQSEKARGGEQRNEGVALAMDRHQHRGNRIGQAQAPWSTMRQGGIAFGGAVALSPSWPGWTRPSQVSLCTIPWMAGSGAGHGECKGQHHAQRRSVQPQLINQRSPRSMMPYSPAGTSCSELGWLSSSSASARLAAAPPRPRAGGSTSPAYDRQRSLKQRLGGCHAPRCGPDSITRI